MAAGMDLVTGEVTAATNPLMTYDLGRTRTALRIEQGCLLLHCVG